MLRLICCTSSLSSSSSLLSATKYFGWKFPLELSIGNFHWKHMPCAWSEAKIKSSSSGIACGLGEPQFVEKLHERFSERLDFGKKKIRNTTAWMFELWISYGDNAHCPIRSRKGEKEVLSQSVKITSKPVKGHHQLWDHWGNYFRRKPITSRIHTIPRMCIHRTP